MHRRFTMSDITRHLGLDQSTVSLALRAALQILSGVAARQARARRRP